MFGVLGSGLFWVGFFIIGFFAATWILKRIWKNAFNFIIGKRNGIFYNAMDGEDWLILIFILILIYLFWPFILAGMVIVFIFKNVLWKSFCKAVKAADSIIPDIEIKKREENE